MMWLQLPVYYILIIPDCHGVSAGSAERLDGVLTFTRTFVPGDVTDDDIVYFSTNLAEDEVAYLYIYVCLYMCPDSRVLLMILQEYFLSVKRDIEQCASGVNVESIKGNQKKKAIYTLKPIDGLRKSASEFI